MRAVIAEIPDGHYAFEDYLEVGPDGLAIRLAVTVAGDDIHFDFSGTDDESEDTSLNAVAAVTRSACYYVVRCLAGADAPTNEGSYAPVRFTLPERSVVAAGPTFKGDEEGFCDAYSQGEYAPDRGKWEGDL